VLSGDGVVFHSLLLVIFTTHTLGFISRSPCPAVHPTMFVPRILARLASTLVMRVPSKGTMDRGRTWVRLSKVIRW
jgi:hypothetical protein